MAEKVPAQSQDGTRGIDRPGQDGQWQPPEWRVRKIHGQLHLIGFMEADLLPSEHMESSAPHRLKAEGRDHCCVQHSIARPGVEVGGQGAHGKDGLIRRTWLGWLPGGWADEDLDEHTPTADR
jgi:hypothetical protein